MEGESLESSVSHELKYDTRDNRFDPREGAMMYLRNELAGLGGDVHFFKSSVGGEYHYPVADNWTVSVDGEIGSIFGIDEDTRISDRYFVGGNNCRGFEFAGVGPRDEPTEDPLGGKHFYSGTVEVGFPLGLPEEYDIRGRIFSDVCSAWDLDQTNPDVQDSDSPRVSVGVGISWRSPLGPFSLDLGFVVMDESFDQTELANFSFGTQF